MPGRWELLATRPGGTVTSLATTSNNEVLAATPAGLRRSGDDGRSWTVLGGALVSSVELVAPSPAFASDATLLAGTPDGLVRSTDGGASWQSALVGSRVLTVTFSPAFLKDGLVLVGTEDDGMLRSNDGGRTWTSANPGLLDLTVLGLAFSPAFDVDHTAFAATASGLFRSTNAGRAWRAIDSVPGEPAVQCVAVSPRFATEPIVVAGTEADGLLRSSDGGRTWHSMDALAGRSVTALAWSNGSRLAAAFDAGVMVSDDAGATWRHLGQERWPVLSLAFAADGALLGGVPRLGVVRSHDLASWQTANAGLQANLVVALAVSSETIYIGGLEDGVAISTDTGASWDSFNRGLGDDTAVFVLAAGPDGIYAATSDGIFRSTAGSGDWQHLHSIAARAVRVDGQRIVAIGMPEALVASADGGASWKAMAWPASAGEPRSVAVTAPTLLVGSTLPATTEIAVWQSSSPEGQDWHRLLLEHGSGVVPLAAPIEGALFVGIGDQLVRHTHGSVSSRATLPGTISVLEASPVYRQDQTILAGTTAGVHLSRDAGATFHPLTEGLGDVPVVAVAFSPAYAHDRLLYAVELGGRIFCYRAAAAE